MPSIDAHITGVVQDQNGWYRIATDDANVKKLDTQDESRAQEAAALMRSGALARIEFTEQESKNINQHTGRPYINRYYNQAGELGEKPAEIPVVATTRAATQPAEAWRICLAAGGKLAVATLPMMPVAQRSFEVQKQIATAWAEFFFFSEAPERPALNGGSRLPSNFPPPASAVPAGNPGAYDQPLGVPAPAPDADIPF